jgi:signal transduction histidine kinase
MRDATGEIVAGIEVIRDITSRKRAEDEIRKLNADLEQRALDLAASYRELEAFSYSVSHDLRTPLTRIYSSVQALAEYRTTLDENGRFFVKTICEASEQMEELIEALISLSQVSSSEMKTEEVDLVPLAREIMADLLLCHPERSVRFSAPPDLTVTGDRQLLEVLLENLLGNAFKYTGKVPTASIELEAIARDSGVIYTVRDNGAGFDMKHAERLFKPFSRLHASHDFPGTGIGLATVQRIVNRHGGEVWAEGEVGKGASFYFTLK